MSGFLLKKNRLERKAVMLAYEEHLTLNDHLQNF